MRYSVIIPAYNRPDEVDELLQSFTTQHSKDLEAIMVEDGSSIPCEAIVNEYQGKLDIHYYAKPNSGPGQTHNHRAERSGGDYLTMLDSDCILPEGYFDAVERELSATPADALDGSDRAHSPFTDIQKVINHSTTSFFTTGGMREGKKKMDKFYPRSFNTSARREAYQALGGFFNIRPGEGTDFSIRAFKGGYRCCLSPGAWVYHKRCTDFKKFFKQVYNSGIACINLYKRYPEPLKVVHLLPAAFALGVTPLLLCTPFCLSSLVPTLFYTLLVCLDSGLQSKSLRIGIYSITASLIQFIGYGTGFWRAWRERCVLGGNEFEASRKNFYKQKRLPLSC